MQRARWRPAILLLAGFWLASILPVLASGGRLGIWDWDHHFASAELERQAVLEHGVLPLWNPYLGGGVPVLQHPLGSVYCPDFWIVLLVGVPVGFKLLLAFRLAVGLVGGCLLGRALGLQPQSAALLAVLSAGSGAWVAHVVLGHAEWSLLAYVPWILLALLRCLDGGRAGWIIGAGAGIALVYLGGNVYLLVALGLFAAALSCVEAARRRRAVLLLLGMAPFALAAGIGAAKLLPSWELFRDHPRHSSGFKRLLSQEPTSALGELPRALYYIFLARAVEWPVGGRAGDRDPCCRPGVSSSGVGTRAHGRCIGRSISTRYEGIPVGFQLVAPTPLQALRPQFAFDW